MKRLYILIIASAVLGNVVVRSQTTEETLAVILKPTNVQYMCLPGVLPELDAVVFNISDTEFNPIHEPIGEGTTLALETTMPLSGTERNEDPGVPVGKFKYGYASSGSEWLPFVMRTWSEIKQTISDGSEMYLNRYTVSDGEFEMTEDDGKYYLTASLKGEAESGGKIYPIEVTVPKTLVNPKYTFFGLPEVSGEYILETPSLQGHYTVRRASSHTWGEYSLQFYNTPLDATNTVCGEGAIITLNLNSAVSAYVRPESLEGDYSCASYINSYQEPFTFMSGFVMEQNIVFGNTASSRIDIFDSEGYRTNSSCITNGNVRVDYIGDLNYCIKADVGNDFGDSYTFTWEGPLFDFVNGHPELAAIDIIEAESSVTEELFDLSGNRVSGKPASGLYIVRRGVDVGKVFIK